MVAIFLDSADVDECRYWLSLFVPRGITTNSTLLERAGRTSVPELAKEILALDPPELHLQVLTEHPRDALDQARALSALDVRVRVKVPLLTSTGELRTPLIRQCVDSGVPVNVTACTTLGQGLVAMGLGVRYVSLLWCRMRDAGEDPAATVRRLAEVRDRTSAPTAILAGSVREPGDVGDAVQAGVDIVTVPPRVLAGWLIPESSLAVARQFDDDARGISA